MKGAMPPFRSPEQEAVENESLTSAAREVTA